ncbi:MAG: HAMP domain-containing histidine kinase [Oscillospiraceae bacterium]|jgi:two-component system sensor histidine kinase VanS|nr:HAMP domain-containing histidine kinase [Oscillospiraceae bacterium]
MRGVFSLRTVRKKVLLLSKLAGAALIASYILSAGLPVSEDASFLIWLGFVSLLVVGIDLLMGRFITRPLARLNASAKRMAGLDFSAPCDLASTDEFGELSASLNTMAENLQQALARLEGALDERRELVDSLSHEMKTPLGIIRAYAEGLQDETDEAKKQKYARIIVSETERMNGLIVTLLDLSALESGAARLNVTRFDFVELAETVAGRLLLDAPGTDFALDYALPEGAVYVQADRRRMEQALGNLLVNARKNVRPGGTLRLEVAAEGGALHVSVFNQGRRIPQEELPRIWTKFYRDSGASYSGSGLGLSITAQILSMHHMPYGAENREDGVRFYFSLPIAEGAF